MRDLKRSYTLSPFPPLVNEWTADNERKQALAAREARKALEAYEKDARRSGNLEFLQALVFGAMGYAVFALLLCVLQ